MSSTRQRQGNNLAKCLHEQEKKELAMIELAHAATDPEAMVIKLADTSIAVPAVPGTVWLHYLTQIAKSLLRHLNLFDCS